MAKDTEARVQQIISNLRNLDKARELFAELNYDPAHDLISRNDLPTYNTMRRKRK